MGGRGIVERGLRNASAVATEPVRVAFLTADQVRKLGSDHPKVEQLLREILAERGG